MTSKRHPVDELADIRAQTRALAEREANIRGAILLGECGREGNEYRAFIATYWHERLDKRALRRHFGAERLKRFMVSHELEQVRLERKRKGA
jgi:hypothetical protein